MIFGLFDTNTLAPSPVNREDEEAEKAPELVSGTAEEFLHEQLLPTYVRSVTGKTAKWCIEWHFHPKQYLSDLPGSTCASTLPPV